MKRTPSGRVATPLCYERFGLKPGAGSPQSELGLEPQRLPWARWVASALQVCRANSVQKPTGHLHPVCTSLRVCRHMHVRQTRKSAHPGQIYPIVFAALRYAPGSRIRPAAATPSSPSPSARATPGKLIGYAGESSCRWMLGVPCSLLDVQRGSAAWLRLAGDADRLVRIDSCRQLPVATGSYRYSHTPYSHTPTLPHPHTPILPYPILRTGWRCRR